MILLKLNMHIRMLIRVNHLGCKFHSEHVQWHGIPNFFSLLFIGDSFGLILL